ncbi:MAG: O-antigen ligase family protein [Elusimicrobiota bacterium]
MLVFIFCSILLLAPALQGVWDFRAQFVFEAAVFLTGGFWLLREIISGRPPAFLSDKRNIPLLCAAFFSLLSALLSPVRALVMPEWWTFAAGLFILCLGSSLRVGELRLTDLALRISAWLIALLSLYQAFILKSPDISASLTNPNSLALFILMLLPLAIKWKDLFLLGAFIIILVWTQSAAALLALLTAAGFYAKDNMKTAELRKNWRLLIVLTVVAALAVSQLELRSFFDRIGWWRAALGMFADRPALGFGPGSFAYVYPAYHSHGAAGVATTYVHNYYLEFLAENGILAFIFWAWAAAFRLKTIRGLKKYALIAAMVHSVVDFGLAVPANFLIFCYLLSDPRLPEADAPPVRTGNKTPFILGGLALACFAVICGVFSSQLKLERLRFRALSDLYAGDYPRAEAALKEAARIAPDNPIVPGMLGQIRMRAGFAGKDRDLLFSAAVELERALILNPYNAAAWRDLERLYADAGERTLLEGLRKRKGRVFK